MHFRTYPDPAILCLSSHTLSTGLPSIMSCNLRDLGMKHLYDERYDRQLSKVQASITPNPGGAEDLIIQSRCEG